MVAQICLLSSMFLFMGSSSSSAVELKGKSTLQTQIDQLTNEFFAQSESSKLVARLFPVSDGVRPQHCDDQAGKGPSCLDVACQYLGTYNCDSASEIEQVARSRRGNWSGDCLNGACSRLGSYNCDSPIEIDEVAKSCRGQRGDSCMAVVCGYLGSYNCDSMSELSAVGRACQNVEGKCIESVCSKLGKYNCDSMSEIERVAKSCRGDD
jgi:hypothetical protein